ncbi:HD-GYP domain-containing protein [Azoarcus olearius]|uniref:Two component response regulator n=1 Tax=Azoarcus sp. (strain BH72) TaxID=418699 RepID=A1K8B1_AZOSB|nr:HD domain-containing phosphohydrolase [Azoarcus olearius]CAL95066.1 putative two component response regulator [Azoarcus olearius]
MPATLTSTARILAIDDEPANLKLLEKILGSQGYGTCALVQDPREAVARYLEVKPDLILLDINMPHLDGFAVMTQLQALQDPLLPPIVILTAQAGREFLLKALDHGARDFVAKPFDRVELLMRVRNLLEAQLAARLLHDRQAVLEDMVRVRTAELQETRLSVVRRLGRAAEYRDNETGVHIVRMSRCCALLAARLGWSADACELILHASPMHDIGKIGIADAILLKPGQLDPDEWEIMKSHTMIGAELLAGDDSELFRMAREIALTHHEKWDGSGYPHGLAGEAIPLAGRIVAVADVFDALTSRRPYKGPWTTEAAVDFIRERAGSAFDPAVVEHFLAVLPEVAAIRSASPDPD